MTATTRYAAAIVAVVAAAGLALQARYSFIDLGAKGMSPAGVAWRLLGYFTILTNLLVTVVMARVAAGKPAGASMLAATTLYIAVVGVTYHALLAGLWSLHGGRYLADQTLHTVVPMASVALWLAGLPKRGLRFTDPLKWMIFPLAYCLYALSRGHFEGWYPYPFIDVGKLGLAAALANAVGLALAFGLAGLAMVALARRRGNGRGAGTAGAGDLHRTEV